MSDIAEDEGALFSTAFEVGLDGSYRRVETDAAGTGTQNRIGRGAEREEMEQLLRLAQASETKHKAGTLEAKLIDHNAALEEQRKQMEQVGKSSRVILPSTNVIMTCQIYGVRIISKLN
jgi:hypothetical protein